MSASEDQPPADWVKPFRSPVCWVILTYAVLFPTVLVLWSVHPTSDVLEVLDGSLVVAQLALIGAWLTLNARDSGTSPFSPELIVPLLVHILLLLPMMALLMLHAILVGAPMWISSPVFANVVLMLLRSKGWQLKRFDRGAMPTPRQFQFSIRSTLLAMVFVAGLFALGALSSLLRDLEDGNDAFAILPEMAITLVVYGSVPVIAIWATLTPGRILPRLAAAGLALGLVTLLLSQDAENRAAVHLISAPVLAGSLLLFLVTLLALRAMRYRVVWGTPVHKQVQPDIRAP